MKIGILTLQYGTNYGGTLQCYALYKTLSALGHEVEVINFIPAIVAPVYKRLLYNLSMCRSFQDISNFLKRLRKPKNCKQPNNKLIEAFGLFRTEHMRMTEVVDENSIAGLNGRYDAIVVGSDQVWSSMVRSHLTYFGEWYPKFCGKLVSYAACSYTDKYPLVRKRKLKALVNRFSAISVRDNMTRSLISQFYDSQVSLVADPTFLYDFSLFVTSPLINEPYIFLYVLGSDIEGGNDIAVSMLKEKLSVGKVVAVTSDNTDIPYADITYKEMSPEGWVNLIANASCVFTDSFHGAVFSLKFKRRFVAYYSDFTRASRLIDLQNKFCLNKNIISQRRQLEHLSASDMEVPGSVCESMAHLKHESEKFLINNL